MAPARRARPERLAGPRASRGRPAVPPGASSATRAMRPPEPVAGRIRSAMAQGAALPAPPAAPAERPASRERTPAARVRRSACRATRRRERRAAPARSATAPAAAWPARWAPPAGPRASPAPSTAAPEPRPVRTKPPPRLERPAGPIRSVTAAATASVHGGRFVRDHVQARDDRLRDRDARLQPVERQRGNGLREQPGLRRQRELRPLHRRCALRDHLQPGNGQLQHRKPRLRPEPRDRRNVVRNEPGLQRRRHLRVLLRRHDVRNHVQPGNDQLQHGSPGVQPVARRCGNGLRIEPGVRRRRQLRGQDGQRGLVYEQPAVPERKLRRQRVDADLLRRECRQLQRVVREHPDRCEQLRDVRHELRGRAGVFRRPVRLHRKLTERHKLLSAGTSAGDLLVRGVRPSRMVLTLQHRG